MGRPNFGMGGNNGWCVLFGPGSSRIRARSRSTDHAALITGQSRLRPIRVTIPDARAA